MMIYKIGFKKATKVYRDAGFFNWNESFDPSEPFGIYSFSNDGIYEIEFYETEEERNTAYENINRIKGPHVRMMGEF